VESYASTKERAIKRKQSIEVDSWSLTTSRLKGKAGIME